MTNKIIYFLHNYCERYLRRFAKLGLSSTSFLLNAQTQRMFPAKKRECLVDIKLLCIKMICQKNNVSSRG